MAIIRFHQPYMRPFSDLERVRREFDRLFGEMSGGRLASDFTGVFPAVNVYGDQDHYVLTAELPGVNPSDVDMTVTAESLTIRGERPQLESGERANYHRRERESGHFRRVVTLPEKVDPNKVNARHENGILYVTLPKAQEVRPRQIEIKSEK
jgi:HSP20 family protein